MNDATVAPTLPWGLPWSREGHTVLCLGIVWHSDPSRIGMIAPLAFGSDGFFMVSRLEPVFRASQGREQGALDDRHISRQPVSIRRCAERTFEITPPESRMMVTVNGRPVAGPTIVALGELGADILIGLSDKVILSIFETSLPLQNEAARHGLIGISHGLQMAWAMIHRVAPTNLPVFLTGATGTGKELAASAIHALSPRAAYKLHTINMATLAPSLAQSELFGAVAGAYTGAARERMGLFAMADGSTLFMDEIGDTPTEVQPMLLRALESGEYRRLGDAKNQKADVRVVSATDRPLDGADFNQPLRRRLEGVVIRLPPLCERRVDIGLLLRFFLTRVEPQLEPFDPAEVTAAQVLPLLLHGWPGNIRELLGVARQIRLGMPVMLGGPPAAVASSHPQAPAAPTPVLPPDGPGGDAPSGEMPKGEGPKRRDPATVTDAELVGALDEAGWNIKAAAGLLNISRTSLYRLMERSPALRDSADISDEQLREVMRRYPGDVEAWARDLRLPKDSLRRHLRRIGVSL